MIVSCFSFLVRIMEEYIMRVLHLCAIMLFTYALLAAPVNSQTIPPNATATWGGTWSCNLGFRRVGEACLEMSEQEKRTQLLAIQAQIARQRNSNIEGHDFSLRDIERRCEAYVYDGTYGELECRGLRELERRCEIYISNFPYGEITCRGSEFRIVEQRCTVEMHSSNYGDIYC